MRAFCLLMLLVFSLEGYAAKNFKGLFGNYRREKFTENEARSSQFGFDLILSTLIPISSIIKSNENNSRDASFSQDLYTATFFNYEFGISYSLGYHWQLYANVGHYDFETRRINQDTTKQLFHQFEMEAIPGVLGVKYRFSTDDIVPYLGIGAGLSYVRRKAFYDYNTIVFQDFSNVLTAQLLLGLEFYFSSMAGIRLETAATFFNLEGKNMDSGGSPSLFPVFNYQGKPWMIRYASGVFFLL